MVVSHKGYWVYIFNPIQNIGGMTKPSHLVDVGVVLAVVVGLLPVITNIVGLLPVIINILGLLPVIIQVQVSVRNPNIFIGLHN